MPQEKTYTITLPETMLRSIYNIVNEASVVKVGLPIMREIETQVKAQDDQEKKKEELNKVVEQIAPKKNESKK